MYYKQNYISYMIWPLMWPSSGRCFRNVGYINTLLGLCTSVQMCGAHSSADRVPTLLTRVCG